MRICENLCCDTHMGWMSAAGCQIALGLGQAWQSFAQAVTILAMPGQTILVVMIRWVALVPGWEVSWKEANTWWR